MGTPVLQITGRNLGPIFTIDSTVEDPAAKENVVNRDTPLLHINGIEVGNSIDIPFEYRTKYTLHKATPLGQKETCAGSKDPSEKL